MEDLPLSHKCWGSLKFRCDTENDGGELPAAPARTRAVGSQLSSAAENLSRGEKVE